MCVQVCMHIFSTESENKSQDKRQGGFGTFISSNRTE